MSMIRYSIISSMHLRAEILIIFLFFIKQSHISIWKFVFIQFLYCFTAFIQAPSLNLKRDTGSIQQIPLCLGMLKCNKPRFTCRRAITKVLLPSDNFMGTTLTDSTHNRNFSQGLFPTKSPACIFHLSRHHSLDSYLILKLTFQ